MLVKRKKIDLSVMADIENANAKADQNEVSIDDVMTALVELAEIIATDEEEEE